ncbi:hypothetical protein OGAPHI_001354 [Ogataea philodendri]|uniref:Major facilitator superfamily (MFS) profile domain-containing protein n=1 Tax=Ogataea philodendri TaxID=1378263 RepID=A0A9P8PBI6_9ASCO|nr:uncharacterized protein OGAPHI_001354 [Ogataea philodendri]KAH3669233.1 hypothetical protein OGAPHI_001354 [Ogataea philodendri]
MTDTKEKETVELLQVNEDLNSLEENQSPLDHRDEVRVVNHQLERRICRKFDFTILPLAALMYLFNSLDKSNISNAKTDGIETDLGIHGSQWNNMLSIFVVPYVLFGPPVSYLIKRFNPANVIPLTMFVFGSITLLLTSAFNYGSLLAGRCFIGVCESAFFPGILYYLTMFYRRDELARRLSIFYGAFNIASAFSGLLSFGVFQIKDTKVKGWQYLFIIEGGLTVLFSVIGFIFLPRSVETAKFLTEEERECAIWRIKTDSSSTEKLTFKEAMSIFKHPVYLLWLLQEFCIGVPLNSYNNWFPQIVAGFGKSTVMTNLYTVAPSVWGATALIIMCFCSDYLKIRCAFALTAVTSTLIGFVVLGCIDTQTNLGPAYFACFLMTTGVAASSVLTSTWYANNTPNESRRIAIASIGIPIGNAGGVVATNIFRPNDAPKYTLALGISAGFGGLAALIICTITLFMVFDNRKRNRLQGVKMTYRDVPTYMLAEGPNNPSFRWMY